MDRNALAVAGISVAYLLISKSRRRNRKHRSLWTKDYFKTRNVSILNDLERNENYLFKNFTRMSRENCYCLLELVAPKIEMSDTYFREAIPAQIKLAICLRYLATGDSYTSLIFDKTNITMTALNNVMMVKLSELVLHHSSKEALFVLWLLTVTSIQYGSFEGYTRPSFINMNNVLELFNLENLLIEFNSYRLCRVPGVSDMMARYNETVKKTQNITESLPKKPFIVIESVYNAGRRTVTELVAHALGAVYSTNPPKIMQGFSTAFDGMFLRRKYYALSKYAASNLVKEARQIQPVVMEKYYYDQAIFIIAKTFIDTDLPPPDSPVYSWPADLLKPDLIFFLNFPDDPTTNMFTKKMVNLFRMMRDPPCVEIDAGHSVHVMANNIIHHINTKLNQEYPLLSDHPREPPAK